MAKKVARKGATKKAQAAKSRTSAGRAKKTAGARTAAAKKRSSKRTAAAKRETIDTGTDKRYVRRGKAGRIKESDDVGRSLGADVRKKAKTKVKSGQGDRGDR